MQLVWVFSCDKMIGALRIIPELKHCSIDAPLTVLIHGIRNFFPVNQVVDGINSDAKQVRNILHGIRLLSQFFSRRRPIYLSVMGLIGIPRFKRADDYAHFSVNNENIEPLLFNQPVAGCFFQTQHLTHGRH